MCRRSTRRLSLKLNDLLLRRPQPSKLSLHLLPLHPSFPRPCLPQLCPTRPRLRPLRLSPPLPLVTPSSVPIRLPAAAASEKTPFLLFPFFQRVHRLEDAALRRRRSLGGMGRRSTTTLRNFRTFSRFSSFPSILSSFGDPLPSCREQSERSSLSTWRDSTHQHRRFGSTSTTGRPPSSTSPTRPTFPSSSNPYRFSYQSSIGRQQADGSYASSAEPQPLPSSASVKSDFSRPFEHVRSRSGGVLGTTSDYEPERRIDATSQLLGRSGSSRSIFSGGGGSSASTRSSIAPSSLPPLPSPLPPRSPSGSESSFVRHPSPTRRVSPEVSRRAQQFGGEGGGWVSPTKSSFSYVARSTSPIKGVSTDDAASTASTLSIAPSSILEKSMGEVEKEEEKEDEDPLLAIERRRLQRRQDLESFRLTFGEPERLPAFSFPAKKGEEVFLEARTTQSVSAGVYEEGLQRTGRTEEEQSVRSAVSSSVIASTSPRRAGPLCEVRLHFPFSHPPS
jgi:uncharacterized membrane protein YgcG